MFNYIYNCSNKKYNTFFKINIISDHRIYKSLELPYSFNKKYSHFKIKNT